MLIFCNGMSRSGSTWSFNVAVGLLRRCFPGEEIHGGYTETPVDFLKAVPASASHAVMKSHGLTPLARTLVRTRAAKVIYTWRDLADAIASRLRIFGGRFEESLLAVGSSLEVRAFHRTHNNVVIVSYDEILKSPRDAVQRIGEYLVPDRVTRHIVAEVAEETSLESMRERVEQVNGMDSRRLYRTPRSEFDPETLLHRHHIGDGSPGRGARVLTPRQFQRIEAFIRKHGGAGSRPNVT